MRPEHVLWVLALLAGCEQRSDVPANFDPGPPPAELSAGAATWQGRCAACHGATGLGTRTGPPLVHPFYVPSHHADEAFRRAVALGVAPHHWNFGAMPPVEGLSGDEVERVIAYARWLQRRAGLIE